MNQKRKLHCTIPIYNNKSLSNTFWSFNMYNKLLQISLLFNYHQQVVL